MEKAYGIRTDLNSPQAKVKRMVAPGQTYGKATEQLASQRAVPLGAPPTEVGGQASKPAPLAPLGRRTDRPMEPITAGAPFGPGIGPNAAGIPAYSPQDAAVEELKMLAQVEQNTDLADLAARWMS